MNELERIVGQMRHAACGGAWHGPSLSELLADVDAASASAHPVPDAHSIWEIVLHLITTQELILDRIQNISRPFTPGDEWPGIADRSAEAWTADVQALLDGEERVQGAVASFPPERLDEPLIQGSSSAYSNFHGAIQHTLYHAGQISLLIKALQQT